MKSIGFKLGLANVLPLVVIILLGIGVAAEKKSDLYDERKLKTRHLTEVAYNLLQYYHQQEKQGVLLGDAARKTAIMALRGVRYGEIPGENAGGYFFISDLGVPVPKVVMHATEPRLEGKLANLPVFYCATSMQMGIDGKVQSLDGKTNLWAGFVTIANKTGHGYLTYLWAKPKVGGGVTQELFPKLTYVKKFEPWGWVIGSGIYTDDVDALYRQYLWKLSLVVLLVGLALYAISTFIARSIARPISDAAKVMNEIEASGDLGRRMEEKGGLETVMISQAFNRMISSFSTVDQLRIMLAEKNVELEEAQAQIKAELEIARAMQIAILPEHFPSVPGCHGAARMLAATTMGGDFYDFMVLPDGRIGLVIADVSGKGVPAAFFMAVARTTLRSLAFGSTGPGECLQKANNVLCVQNPMELFVTVFYGVFDPTTGLLIYANGGHNSPLLRHADGQVEALALTGGMVLGTLPDIEYQENVVQFTPGDRLVLYTDGVTEAFDPELHLYDEQHFIVDLALKGGSDAQSVLDGIFKDVTTFAGTAPQSDDITLAVIAWDPLTS
jgi:serine phosphatase RsbU (regulator of sigma subunit)